MKKNFLTAMLGIIAAIALSATAFALEASYVEATNNVGKKDVVTVNGVESKSVVSVFAENGMLLGKKTAGNTASVNVNVTLPSIDGGKITVSVLEKGAAGPDTVLVSYPAEPVSDAPTNAIIENNVDKKDTITIDGLESRDTVTVYSAQSGGKKLVSGKVKKNSDEITLSHKQLGTAGGPIWITVTSFGKHESPRTSFTVAAEKASAQITNLDSITITNNVGKKGTVEVSDLEAGETITVYSNESGKKLGSAKCSKNKTEVKVSNVQLVKDGGKILMTIKRANELESNRFEVDYAAQEVTPTPAGTNIVSSEFVNNPAGTSDTLYFDGLEAGDIVKVYANDTTSTVYLKGTVASGKTDVTLTKTQFGVDGAELWISNTRKNMLESERTMITVPKENKSKELDTDNITITNNAGIASTIFVTGLDEGTTITAYDKETGGKTLGSAKVASGSTNATISVGSLDVKSGFVWVTRKDTGLAESIRTKIEYDGKTQSEWDESLVTEIEYNVGIASTITVSGLDEGDVVKAYTSETTSTTIGQAARGASDRYVTISTYSLKSTGGHVYLTLTKKGQIESKREDIEYKGEEQSEFIDTSKVTIENNANSDAVITVYGLKKGDLVTVYQDETSSKTFCKGTADTNYITLYTSSLKSTADSIYITRQSTGLAESVRKPVSYAAQVSSTSVSASDVTIVNNAGIADTITVSKLNANDVVKVYDSTYATTPIASGTVVSSTGDITLYVTQLGTGKGNVYISVTNYGSSESTRTAVSYTAEQESDRLNNVSFATRTSMSVEITISGLQAGDVIRLYADASGTSSYGSITSGGESVTMTLSVSGTSSGYVYISRTSVGKHESVRSSYQYGAYVSTTSSN